MSFTKELWSPGDQAFFEYHCYEGHDSSDAELWYRSQTKVIVVGLEPEADNEFLENYEERMKAVMPLVYLVAFSDGERFNAWEDELLTSPRGYRRPPPPKRR